MKTPRSLGRYEIVDVIGHGGMGTLYRARDPRIGRYVAIKLLRPEFDTPEIRDRFSREARAAGSLSHPNIVTIYDVGEHDGLPFIAMEYVRGETFTDLVCLRPPLTVSRKVQLTEEVCAGLAHAHEAGIVHRDIKPANLIVGPEGTVKILDFGIAKVSDTGITVPGAIMGTMNYMSPEQVNGTDVDARADIFSVGAVLYELLSHQQAFPGEGPDEVLPQILNSVPKPITEFFPDIDPRLVRLVDRALEKNPNRRFQDIAALRKELASIRSTPQSVFLAPQPAPTPIEDPASPANRDRTRQPGQQIEEHLTAARQAFDSGNYDAAIESCKQVLMLDPSEDRAISQIERVHAAIDAQQIELLLAEARQQLSRGATQAAMKSLNSASLLSQSHPEIARIREEVLGEEARVRTIAVRTAVERAKAAHEGGDPIAALHEVEQALALDPNNAEAQALAVAAEAAVKKREEEARIRLAVGDARRRFVSGEHQAAIQLLEALQPASNALVAETLEELRLALREIEEQQRLEKERIERQRRIAALLETARAALKNLRLDETRQSLEQIREIDATVPELLDLTARLHQAQAAARLEEDLQRTLGDFDHQLAQGDLPRAGELLKAAASLASTDSRVRSARQRFEQAAAAVAAREAAEARRREGEQLMDEAAARLETLDLAGAADMLRRAAELAPQHPRAAELSRLLREAVERQAAAEAAARLKEQIEDLIRSASRQLHSTDDAGGDLSLALRDVTQALALDPEHIDARNLKTAIDQSIAARREAARVQTAISNARRRFANGKHQAAFQVLEDFQPASHPAIMAALDELRGTLRDIEEQRRVERERTERQERVAALLVEARTALREQRFDATLSLLSKIEETDRTVPELALLAERVRKEQAASRLRAEVEHVLTALDECLTRGDLSAASDRLNAATALNAADTGVRRARQRIEQAIAAREAERVAEERLRRTVDELLSAAEGLLQSPKQQAPDVTLAMQKITQALSLAPEHPAALTLKAHAEEALAAQRETARIAAIIRNARSRFAMGKHHAALQLLENLDATAHPVVAETLKELRGALGHAGANAPEQDDEGGARELTLTDTRSPEGIRPAEQDRPRRWGTKIRQFWK